MRPISRKQPGRARCRSSSINRPTPPVQGSVSPPPRGVRRTPQMRHGRTLQTPLELAASPSDPLGTPEPDTNTKTPPGKEKIRASVVCRRPDLRARVSRVDECQRCARGSNSGHLFFSQVNFRVSMGRARPMGSASPASPRNPTCPRRFPGPHGRRNAHVPRAPREPAEPRGNHGPLSRLGRVGVLGLANPANHASPMGPGTSISPVFFHHASPVGL